MFIDFRHLDAVPALQADVCIVGAGAAGLALAREFLSTTHSVILLEGGGSEREAETQSLYDSEVVGYPHTGIHGGRARILGGTTTLWAGQALPLGELDFRCRPWVPDSGWPITRNDLEPYYRRAEGAMGLKPQDYSRAMWPEQFDRLLQFDPEQFVTLSSQFSPQPNFAIAHSPSLRAASNIQVVLHANVTGIEAAPNGSSVESVVIDSLAGRRSVVKARYFVICCGGIETARLLLVSDSVQKSGLGNDFDLVGRYFQDHMQGATVPLRSEWPDLRVLHDPRYIDNVARASKVGFSDKFQEKHEILNATVGVTYDGFVQEDSPVEASKRVVRGVLNRKLVDIRWRDICSALEAPHQVIAAGYRRYAKGVPAFRMEGTPHIGLQCECAPIPSSRVKLSQDTDALGVRRTCLDWRLSPLISRTVHTVVAAFAGEMKRLGIADCDIGAKSTEMSEDWNLFDANHHIGTTRMSVSARQGVVNRDCRLHSVDNLYIGSSSVFPTGGHSNPTLTILALVIRMSDHLKARLAAS